MKHRFVPLGGLVVLLATAAAGAQDIAIAQNQIRNLGITTAAPEPAREVASVEATARVIVPPSVDVIVGTPQAGLLTVVNVDTGDKVVEGQVIARLQSAGFLTLQREYLDAVNNSLLATAESNRDLTLLDEGIIAARRMQESRARARAASARLNEHRQLLQIAGMTDEGIRLLEREENLLQVLEIRAPFSGVILDRMADTGERLDAMSPICRLGDLSSLWLEVQMPFETLTAVRTGMRVAVDGSGIPLPAVVTTIGESVNAETQTVVVRATLTESGHGLKPGQFVSVRVVSEHTDSTTGGVWAVPVSAVTRSGDDQFLFVQTGSGFAVRQAFVIGADESRLYLNAEIDGNSSIAVTGVSALKALWAAQSDSDS